MIRRSQLFNALVITVLCGHPAFAAYAAVAEVCCHYSGASTGCTTSAINTTGADLLVAVRSYSQSAGTNPTISDSKSNTWANSQGNVSGVVIGQLDLAYNATTGTGHTFTLNPVGVGEFGTLCVAAFSGSQTSSSPNDVGNSAGTGTGVTTFAPGTTGTLNQATELVVSGLTLEAASVSGLSIDSGFTIYSSDGLGSHLAAIAYKIKTTTAAENPNWSWTGGTGAVATIEGYKSAGAAAATAAHFPLLGVGP